MRRLITLLVAFALLAIPAVFSGCEADQASQSASPSAVAYQILDKTGSRLDSYATIYYYVLVPAGTNRDGLEDVAAEVVAQAKQGRPFSRLYISFYDFPELHEHGYQGPPLGCVRYGGTAAGRDPTAPGAYEEMTYTYRLSGRDWAKRPSQDDVTWAVYRLDLLRRAERQSKSLSAHQLDRRTSRHFGVTAVDVASAVQRVDAWVTEPGGRAW